MTGVVLPVMMRRSAWLSLSLSLLLALLRGLSGVRGDIVTHTGFTAISTPDAVQQVAYDGENVCVVTRTQGVVCGIAGAKDGAVTEWPTALYVSSATWVAVAGKTAWVADEWHLLHIGPLKMPDKLMSYTFKSSRALVSDGEIMCEIGMHYFTFCTFVNRTIETSQWFKPDATLARSIDIFASRMVGVKVTGVAYALKWTNGTSKEIGIGDPPTGLRAIATDGTFTCVIKNATEAVVCQQLPDFRWQLIGARFSQIALRGGRLYGVASNGTLWTTALTSRPEGSVDLAAIEKYEEAAEAAAAMNVEPSRRAYFTQIESVPSNKTFAQVTYDGKQLCGVTNTAISETLCATVTKGRALEWRSLRRPMKWVSIANGQIWGVTATAQVYWTESDPASSGWSRVQASYAKVSFDGHTLCGLDADKLSLLCGSKDITKAPITYYDTLPLRDIGIVDGTIYGLTARGATYGYGPQAFAPSSGPFQSVASDGQILCAVADSGDTLSCVSKTDTRWVELTVDAQQIAMHGHRVFGVSKNGSLWTTKLQLRAEGEPAEPVELLSLGSRSTSTPSPSSTASSPSSGLNNGATIAIVVGALVVVAVLALFVVRARRGAHKAAKQIVESPRNAADSPSTAVVAAFAALPSDSAGTHTVPKSKGSSASVPSTTAHGDWMNDAALLPWRIPRRHVMMGERIGHGAFGDVYRGRYDDSDVAIKVLSVDRRRDMDAIDRFAQEALFVAALQHERIVQFIGAAWTTPSDLCIVSEFMAGGDLQGLLQRFRAEGRPLGLTPDKVKIALHVAHALTYVHSLDPVVLHRDLKSKNVLLTEDGDAKLTDFGVAREWDDLTLTAGVGSLLWMAPEVAHGKRYDERADIYSFGIVLSELDSHELPYAHARAERGDLHTKQLHDTTICQLVATGALTVNFSDAMDPDLRALASSCVAVDPSQRPPAREILWRIHQVWMRVNGDERS